MASGKGVQGGDRANCAKPRATVKTWALTVSEVGILEG